MTRIVSVIFCVTLVSILWSISIVEANVDIIASAQKDSDLEKTNTLLAVLASIVTIFTATVGYLYKTFAREAKKTIINTAADIAKRINRGEFEKFTTETKDQITNKIYREYNSQVIRQHEFVRHHGKPRNFSKI